MMFAAQTPFEMSGKSDPNPNDNIAFADGGGGCCFWIPRFGSNNHRRKSWGRIPTGDNEQEDVSSNVMIGDNKNWWDRPLLKMREWSELVAGPKWKTFIRRFNKGRPNSNNNYNNKQGKFQYDPLSYSLNFDEGPCENGDVEDDRLRRDFSLRYAAIPGSLKNEETASLA